MHNNQDAKAAPGDILIVDDEIANLKLLKELLSREGFHVRPADHPKMAIDSALLQPPALILLDVRMPEMDGFEVCKRLKQDERTRDIPIIFISALQDVQDKIRGFEVGAVDYISKPFQEEEVLARVRTHMELRKIQLNLEQLVDERTAELARREAKYRGLVENALVGVFTSTLDGRFIFVNDAMARMFDFDSPEQMMAQGSLERWRDQKDRERMLAELQQHGSVTNFETITITHTDRHIYVLFSAKQVGNDIVGMVMDITERKQAERKYQIVADFTYDWEYWVKIDGRLEYISPSCERISGYSVQDFMANPSLLRNIIVPEDRGIWDQHMNNSIKDLALKEVQFRIKNKDGDIRWIEHASRPVIDRQGNLDSFRASNRDITVRKQVEISLQASREEARLLAGKLITTQEAERARLARELHDDITQRLAFLNIEMDKLEIQDQSLSEPSKNRLRQIGNDIGELSSDIHMISRQLHPSILDDLGLIQAIETECRNFTRLREVPVTLDLDGTLKDLSKEICLCIYRTLQESLRNIAQHAKATDIQVMLSRKDDTVHFLVKDNGKGFDPASNKKSSGLGMASMAERARLIQGDLYIESRPGEGTAIRLEAPYASRE